MSEAVLIPIIAGGFSIIVALITAAAKLNKRDHDVNTGKLDELLRGHERIETKIDGHIGDHARGDV